MSWSAAISTTSGPPFGAVNAGSTGVALARGSIVSNRHSSNPRKGRIAEIFAPMHGRADSSSSSGIEKRIRLLCSFPNHQDCVALLDIRPDQ